MASYNLILLMFPKLLSYDSLSWEKFSLLMQPHFIFTVFLLSKYNLGFFQVKLFFIIHVVIPGHMYVGVYIHVKIYTCIHIQVSPTIGK